MLVRFAASTCSTARSDASSVPTTRAVEAAILEQRHRDLVGVRDDVVIREDVALGGVDDDARAGAFDLAPSPGRALEVEEAPQQLLLRILRPGVDARRHRDIDDGRRDRLDDRRERRQLAWRVRLRERETADACSGERGEVARRSDNLGSIVEPWVIGTSLLSEHARLAHQLSIAWPPGFSKRPYCGFPVVRRGIAWG